jgi:hypothetical protein
MDDATMPPYCERVLIVLQHNFSVQHLESWEASRRSELRPIACYIHSVLDQANRTNQPGFTLEL